METLSGKIEKSKEVILNVLNRFNPERVGVGFTGDKDSTLVLHLIRDICGGGVPFKVIRIDTSVKFPENTAFVEKMKKLWHLELFIFRNEDALRYLEVAQDKEFCCQLLKTEPLKTAIKTLGLEALITGVRWDENPVRVAETYFSERTEPDHIRVHPILHFREKDVWGYIEDFHVPHCSLYQKGYRSLGCMPCTKPSENSDGTERLGTSKDQEEIMDKLRRLGYF